MKSIALMSLLLLQICSGYSQPGNRKTIAPTNEGVAGSVTAAGAANLSAAPAYRGGNDAFLKFIEKNITYPKVARDNKTEGRVIVQFRVDADGHVKDARVPEGMGIGSGCDEEAVRVVMSSSQWKPGMRMGTATAMWYEVPVLFVLSELK